MGDEDATRNLVEFDQNKIATEDEDVNLEVLTSEHADNTMYLLGVQEGMEFAYKCVLKTIDSGAKVRRDIIESNMNNSAKLKVKYRKRLESDK